MEVYVITCPEDGWDCVVGALDASSISKDEDPVVAFCKTYFGYTDEQAQAASDNSEYIAHYTEVVS